jgi:integrase
MSNIIYEDKMYNEEVKTEFMNEYGEGTKKILSRIFKVSRLSEEDLGKDLYSFSREEIRRLGFLYMPKTEYSSKANIQWIHKYIDHCIDMGYKKGLNPLDSVDKEWKEQFVNKSIKKYWTKQEIQKIVNQRVNAQDACTIYLPFLGVRGVANSEILNLTKQDLDSFNNKLHLIDLNGKKRTITVDDLCVKICQQALKEDQYEKKNGNASKDTKSPTANLVENFYVIKSSVTRTDHMFEAEKNIVHRRLANIADEIGEPHFSPMNILYSGMLSMANDLLQQRGKLDDDEYRQICEKFDIDADQSLQRLKSEFLNIETIESLYGDNKS